MTFGGFDRRAIELLANLPDFDEKQYASARDLLADGLRKPGLALIEVLAAALDPSLTVNRRSSVSPLHRDLRFAAPGTPRYKDHLLLTAWRGPDKKTAPTLWMRIDAESVGFASGIAFTSEVRERWRQAVGERRGELLVEHISRLKTQRQGSHVEVAGDQLKRVPKPWSEDHPRADLLRRTGFQIRFRERLPHLVSEPGFASWCEARLRDLLPTHEWLVAELGAMGGSA